MFIFSLKLALSYMAEKIYMHFITRWPTLDLVYQSYTMIRKINWAFGL